MKKTIIALAIILMAGTVYAGDPNSMPNPPKGGVSWCIDEVHRTFTFRIDMSTKDRWYLANSEMFLEKITKWVASLPRYMEDLKRLGAIKWMNSKTLEQTEAERKR